MLFVEMPSDHDKKRVKDLHQAGIEGALVAGLVTAPVGHPLVSLGFISPFLIL